MQALYALEVSTAGNGRCAQNLSNMFRKLAWIDLFGHADPKSGNFILAMQKLVFEVVIRRQFLRELPDLTLLFKIGDQILESRADQPQKSWKRFPDTVFVKDRVCHQHLGCAIRAKGLNRKRRTRLAAEQFYCGLMLSV